MQTPIFSYAGLFGGFLVMFLGFYALKIRRNKKKEISFLNFLPPILLVFILLIICYFIYIPSILENRPGNIPPSEFNVPFLLFVIFLFVNSIAWVIRIIFGIRKERKEGGFLYGDAGGSAILGAGALLLCGFLIVFSAWWGISNTGGMW